MLTSLALALLGAASPAERPWTLLVYGAADNNADAPVLWFVDSIRKALDDDPGFELLFLVDRREKHERDPEFLGEPFSGTRLYRVHGKSVERLAGGPELPQIRTDKECELDTADPATLKGFIDAGKRIAPAQHYALLVYSHADGRSMCPDETSGHSMSIAETSRVLGARESVDFMGLELCNMGGIEVAYQWRPGPERFGANVLVAIPNAGPPLDWERAFERIRTSGHASSSKSPLHDPARMSAADLGCLVIEEGKRGRELAAKEPGMDVGHEAAGAFDLSQTVAVKQSLDKLALLLGKSDARAAFFEARGGDEGEHALNYDQGGPYVDLYDLCRRAAANEHLAPGAREAARAVDAALEKCTLASFGMSAYSGFESGKNGLYMILPRSEAPDAKKKRWKQFTWYSPKTSQVGKTTFGGFDFLRDGATEGNGVVENWFELLDSWYDENDAQGGFNAYRW